MVEFDYRDESAAEKSINAWRQSQRKIMIDIVEDLIETSHKYAKSQYTPGNQRARWTKLAGQLIWYKDQILKNFSLEAMSTELNDLKKRMVESEKRREREIQTQNLPVISFRKPDNRKAEDAEKAADEQSSDSSSQGI